MTSPATDGAEPLDPYRDLGGETGVRELVDRFYDRMEESPAAATIRAMHQDDLSEMRERLTLFLCGWLGGPPLHSERYGPICIRSAHDPFPIDAAASKQWMDCMRDALMETPVDEVLREALEAAFARMAEMLRNRDD
jgi:hemoglobin